jgi:Fe-S-cluster-containing dehydrogenase component
VLVDTQRCIACLKCETACAEINGLPAPDHSKEATDKLRPMTDKAYTVVNRHRTATGKRVNVKTQCMHCLKPGCASACPVGAFEQTKQGAVLWQTQCFGCRYCMVACPFDVPKFEYDTPVPEIKKCTFCYDKRVSQGLEPACVSVCPVEALKFGRRSELIKEAHARIAANPGVYVDRVFGEQEVGGTCWLYLAPVDFGEIGFKADMGTRDIPSYGKPFMKTVHAIDFVVPPVLLGMGWIVRRRQRKNSENTGE